MKKVLFSPSLMCMDFLDIRNQIEILNTRADMLHVDIMDGHYVPNITLSPDFVGAIRGVSKIPLDCHLMVTNPEQYFEPLAKAGADIVSPHAEVINAKAFRVIKNIQDLGMKAGIILNPATPIEMIKYYIHKLYKITVMTVDPGFAGQPFIEEMLDKIRELKELKEKYDYSYIIEIDGSCNKNTFKKLYDAGAEAFIVGSSGLFNNASTVEEAWEIMINTFNKETEE